MAHFHSPEELIADIRQGKMVILVDDEDRENEGDLVVAAQMITPEIVNFMAREARGLICLALAPEQIDRLQLPQMVRDDLNDSPNKTAFTVSIEAAQGVTTGISAHDRAHTILVASHPQARPEQVRSPGHIFPIRARRGGVLRRAGHTEGSVDLSTLAGLNPAAVICEVMNEDGSMARVPDLMAFAEKHRLKIGTIVDLIQYRLRTDRLVDLVAENTLNTSLGTFKALVFKSRLDAQEHLVLQKGEIRADEPVLVRMHVDAYVRDLLGFLSNPDNSILRALEKISVSPSGLLVLLRGNNRRQGLAEELDYFVQHGRAGRFMDERDYGIGAQILRTLGVHKIHLLSQHADRKVGLKGFDLEIIDTVPMNGGES